MVFINKNEGSHDPLPNIYEYIFWAWKTSRTKVSKLQLENIHHHFHHTTPENLYQLLLRVQPGNLTNTSERPYKTLPTSFKSAKNIIRIISVSASPFHHNRSSSITSSQWTLFWWMETQFWSSPIPIKSTQLPLTSRINRLPAYWSCS